MIKKLALGLVALLLLTVLVLGINTARKGSRQLDVPAIPVLAVDEAGVAGKLAEAVRLRTISSRDDATLNADQFTQLHALLQNRFPKAHAALKREMVGDLSLLYTWTGSKTDAKPIMLMAHQDVVPVATGTEKDWTEEPFKGTVKDGFVWGRGAWDDKGNLIAQMEAIEMLVASGYQPERTVYLAFGADEEVGGRRGAAKIAALLKDLKRRLEQAAAKTSVLLLKSASGSIAEICARTLQTHRTPWLDLSASSAPLTQEMLQNASGGIVFISDLAQLGKLQQMNLVFALERLERHNLQLVAASTRPMAGLVEAGWDALLVSRLGEVWVALPQISGHADDVPEIASMLLSHLAERGEVPLRHFSSGAQNSLRLHRWQGEWAELLTTVKNLALSALEEEISAEDVARILQTEVAQIGIPLPLPAMFFDQPLREAREAFERMYFEYHLTGERGSMTRLAEKTGLERTHLYRKLKQLGLNIGRRGDERD